MDRVGLLVGGGDLPKIIAQELYQKHIPFACVFFRGISASSGFPSVVNEQFRLGQVGNILHFLKSQDVRRLLMVGYFERPTLAQVLPDWKGAAWMAKLLHKKGDDDYLRCLLSLVETEGFRIINPEDCVGDTLVCNEGAATIRKPAAVHMQAMQRGVSVLDALAPVDVGQALVVEGSKVVAIEAAEGTQSLIERSAAYLQTKDGILLKMAKRTQDLRLDRPTIGPDTVLAAHHAGLAGIVIEAQTTFVLYKQLVIQMTNEHGMFLYAYPRSEGA